MTGYRLRKCANMTTPLASRRDSLRWLQLLRNNSIDFFDIIASLTIHFDLYTVIVKYCGISHFI